MQFCLYLNKRAHIGQNEFEKKNKKIGCQQTTGLKNLLAQYHL